jgi:hypothetical protein
MPNWCYNTIEIEGPKRAIDTFEKHLDDTQGKEWFSYFLQIPEELKDDWYGWNVENYGCKWNCDAMDWNRTSDESIAFTFDSPWGPPIALYENIENIELENEWGTIDYYRVTARYLEEGLQFMGQFVESSDEYYDYTDLESLNEIPEDLVEYWGVRERMEEMEDDNLWLGEEEEEEGLTEDDMALTDEEAAKELERLKAEFDKLMVEDNNVNKKEKN